jgi:tRNA threonylcarbamoyladenosine biosynthesis protein TsaB
MHTLAIDCSSEACSVALFDGPDLLAGDWQMLGRGHAEALIPKIAALPDKGRAERIVVGLGPGSFTGVRIGLAAARALGLAWSAPVFGYPSLALVAAMAEHEMAQREHRQQPILIAATAGHGEWFVQNFAANAQPTTPLASLNPETAMNFDTDWVAGSQADTLVAMRGYGCAMPIWPDARCAMLLASGHLTTDLTPIYGRAPDAKIAAPPPL